MPFGDPVRSEAELRALVPEPTHLAYRKQIDRLDAHCHALIAAAPIVFVASAAPDGTCDVSPKGGPPGFARALDEQRLLIPEGKGNNRLDSLAKESARTDSAPVRRAMHNLHAVLHARLSQDGADKAIQLEVAAILDEAAGRIERL